MYWCTRRTLLVGISWVFLPWLSSFLGTRLLQKSLSLWLLPSVSPAFFPFFFWREHERKIKNEFLILIYLLLQSFRLLLLTRVICDYVDHLFVTKHSFASVNNNTDSAFVFVEMSWNQFAASSFNYAALSLSSPSSLPFVMCFVFKKNL